MTSKEIRAYEKQGFIILRFSWSQPKRKWIIVQHTTTRSGGWKKYSNDTFDTPGQCQSEIERICGAFPKQFKHDL